MRWIGKGIHVALSHGREKASEKSYRRNKAWNLAYRYVGSDHTVGTVALMFWCLLAGCAVLSERPVSSYGSWKCLIFGSSIRVVGCMWVDRK